MHEAASREKAIKMLFSVIDVIKTEMVVAIDNYIMSMIMIQAIFTELHADTETIGNRLEDLKDKIDDADGDTDCRRVKRFYAKLMDVSKGLAANLQGVVHTFNAIEQQFLAVKEFAKNEKEYSAKIVLEIQDSCNKVMSQHKSKHAFKAGKYLKDL